MSDDEKEGVSEKENEARGIGMRFDPFVCPKCGEEAIGTSETIPGVALFSKRADGSVDWSGQTDCFWDGQMTDREDDDERGREAAGGRPMLVCGNGDMWPARQTVPDEPFYNEA